MMARVMINKPKIVLLDEHLAALDPIVIQDIQNYSYKFLFLEIDLKNSLAKSKKLIFNLGFKESSRKMFLSGEWDATSKLLENENLIEEKYKDLPYLKFNTHF